jgi:DNA-binding MarR family transcriptional regulator
MGWQSILDGVRTIYPPMSKPSASSTLYRLIEAGQLAHQSLLVPLVERGLEPGDDAVLFELATRHGATEAELIEALRMTAEGAAIRIERLLDRDLVARRAIGSDLAPGLALTERGERIRALLADNWAELENALLGELRKKRRRQLGDMLARFVDLLRI